jgi:HlyD family secretion protein
VQQTDSPSAAAGKKAAPLSADALDFMPGLLAIQESPPARLPRVVMYMVAALCAILLIWAMVGKLDIVASAEGHLVPQTFVKIVQPADGGIVQQILVKEGEHVTAGQVLLRMDPQDAKADQATIQMQLALRSLQLRRIDAELNNHPLVKKTDDPADLYAQVDAQYRERRRNYQDALGEAQQAYAKAQRDVDSGREVLAKLRDTTPLLKQQADAYADMARQGYVPKLQMQDKQREYLEKARDLKAQEATLASLEAAMAAAGKQVEQVTSKYRSDLENERIDAVGQYRKLQQDGIKQDHKTGLLELRAPQAGIAKDLATHTIGTVVSPGTVLLTLVPDNEPLIAEVMVKNDDVGFVYPQQKVKLKLATYPFQEYGMLDGEIMTIGADASDGGASSQTKDASSKNNGNNNAAPSQFYKALVSLKEQQLTADGKQYKLVPGMQVVAEINEGKRTVMEYLLSPVQKTILESGHER